MTWGKRKRFAGGKVSLACSSFLSYRKGEDAETVRLIYRLFMQGQTPCAIAKYHTVDFLSKKRKANEGEMPQYYVEGSHDAIIEPAPLFLLRCVQIGINIRDLDLLTIGMVNDMYAELNMMITSMQR